MTEPPIRRAMYWTRHTDGHGAWRTSDASPAGGDLAALRRGIGKEPGSVPQMWPYYTTLREDGRASAELTAEHLTLTLFAVHQQSKHRPVHHHGVGFGQALQALRREAAKSGGSEALDRRFAAAATATSLTEVAVHVRGLITQLRAIDQGLDYSTLFRDLRDWQFLARAPQVRRRWGSQYFVWKADQHPDSDAVAGSSQPSINPDLESP